MNILRIWISLGNTPAPNQDRAGSTCRLCKRQPSLGSLGGTRLTGLLALGAATVAVAFAGGFRPARSQPAQTDELKLTASVRSGVQSIVALVRIWDTDCHPLPVNVNLTSTPLNGVATVKAGLSALPENPLHPESVGSCAGAIMIGRHIMYRSNPGFHGFDRVSYDAVNADGKSISTIVTITVR
jgi:hypothetical protein